MEFSSTHYDFLAKPEETTSLPPDRPFSERVPNLIIFTTPHQVALGRIPSDVFTFCCFQIHKSFLCAQKRDRHHIRGSVTVAAWYEKRPPCESSPNKSVSWRAFQVRRGLVSPMHLHDHVRHFSWLTRGSQRERRILTGDAPEDPCSKSRSGWRAGPTPSRLWWIC